MEEGLVEEPEFNEFLEKTFPRRDLSGWNIGIKKDPRSHIFGLYVLSAMSTGRRERHCGGARLRMKAVSDGKADVLSSK